MNHEKPQFLGGVNKTWVQERVNAEGLWCRSSSHEFHLHTKCTHAVFQASQMANCALK
jgi:hypothetical protein